MNQSTNNSAKQATNLALNSGLQGDRRRAIETYREAVRVIEANKADVRTDKLQRLHTCHNLSTLLEDPRGLPEGVAPTLRDGSLVAEAEAIRRKERLGCAVSKHARHVLC
eukprot:360624-Chlamydomonas_euryale.AAC.2